MRISLNDIFMATTLGGLAIIVVAYVWDFFDSGKN